MTKVYLVAYDFPGSADKYSALFEELKNSDGWWHYIDSAWLLSTRESAEQIYNRLEPHIDEEINLLIVEVGKDRQGWLPKKAWEWIKKHMG